MVPHPLWLKNSIFFRDFSFQKFEDLFFQKHYIKSLLRTLSASVFKEKNLVFMSLKV